MKSRTPEDHSTPDSETLDFIRDSLKPHLPLNAKIMFEGTEPDQIDLIPEDKSSGEQEFA